MKANSIVIALFLGNVDAVQVSKFISPLHYAIQNQGLAQIESSTDKFMSISGQLDAESSFENSSTSKLDDFVNEAHATGQEQAKTKDNQRYDAKSAIQDTNNGVASLGSALEQSKKEILKNTQDTYSSYMTSEQKAPESYNVVKSSPPTEQPAPNSAVAPMVIPRKAGQAPITATQLADDALSAPLNINQYIDSHDLDKQEFPTGAVKTDEVAFTQPKEKAKHSTLTQTEEPPKGPSDDRAANPPPPAPVDAPAQASTPAPAPQAQAQAPNQESSLIDNIVSSMNGDRFKNMDMEKQAQANQAPANNNSPQTQQPVQSTAQPEEKKEEPNIDQQAAHLDFLSKKVTASVDGAPGTSVSMADMVNTQNDPKQKDKLTNNEIMNVINSFDQNQAITEAAKPSFSGSGFRVDLTNEDGAGYVGTIFLGSEDQPAKVLFDTGSDFLAVTSDLCLDPSLGKQEQDEPVFNTTSFAYVPSGKDLRKCKSTAYLSKESKTAHRLGKDDEQLDYGSAKLSGKLFNDRTCLGANQSACADFDFLGLYQAKGLDDIDGILGLAVHPEKDRRNLNYVWTLKNQHIIDQAIVSFSIAGPESSESSYAMFGGLNADQIVGGVGGLKKIQTMAYRPDWMHSVKQWALEGRNMLYGGEEFKSGDEQKYPAIIDTGSSNFGVPEKTFNFLREKWEKDIGRMNLDCVNDDNFCQVMTPCNEVAKQLKPVGIQISDFVFEMNPELYLHQAEGTRCQFAIHQNQMKGSSGNLYLIGDTLLRHLYQVYDFENETIALGINTHSDGKITMYDAGKRPEDRPKVQVEDDKMTAENRQRFNDIL